MDMAQEHFDEQTGALVRDESHTTRQVVNSMRPIWTLPEDAVSQEEENDFYRFEFRDPENPLCCIRARARGAIEYDAMLFVPAQSDPELFTKDFHYGLRLYSSGVLIDEAGDGKGMEIYYAAGSDINRLRQTPAVCALLERGRDVLLCPHGAQDEFCLMTMGTYKGAGFHSAASANLDLAGEVGVRVAVSDDAGLLEAIGARSPIPLVRVEASRYLREAGQPASRISTEGLMTISMAKFVHAKLGPGEAPKSLYVLEVNLSSPVVALARTALLQANEDALGACAQVLVGMALLAEDVALPDPSAFNRAVCAVMDFATHACA